MGRFCEICCKPSGMFPLCRECNDLKDEGIVVKCEDCGKWHIIDEPCDCEEDDEVDYYDEEEVVSDCILCKSNSHGYLFCKDCYYKYKNKELYLRIKNCKEIEKLDADYESQYVCEDGHRVKSKSERDIDNYLFRHKIFHVYEKAFPIDDNPEHDLHPDFYLPDEDLYIEHWGYDESNIQYSKEKNYKLDIYKKRGVTLICMYEKTDAKDINTALDRKLSLYKKGKINFEV